MTIYTYSVDWPTTDTAEALRLGYRVPREILLPPYLFVNDYFREFMDAVDNVFEPLVDIKTEILGDLRNMWVTNPTLEANQISDAQLIPFEAWSQPERQLLVKQVNMLGMKLQSAGIISNDSYQSIARWVGAYWFGKGTQSFINFINYCLSSSLTVTKLWTQDYVNFVPAGDPSIGTPIWEGGTWYPTTHVSIIASGGLQNIDIQSLVNFFYEIANYNLVLNSVNLSYDLWITDDPTFQRTDAEVVAVGLWADSAIVMSNILRYGVDGPPTYDISPDIPMSALTNLPTNTDYTSVFMLTAPTAWVQDPQGRRMPAYSAVEQAPTNGGDLPSTLCGGASTTGGNDGYTLLFSPVGWTQVPGSTRSTARIPYYTAVPVPRTVDTDRLPSQMVGNQRNNLLVNPVGFVQLNPGQFVPYW